MYVRTHSMSDEQLEQKSSGIITSAGGGGEAEKRGKNGVFEMR